MSDPLPECLVDTAGLVLRRWTVADAEVLSQAVTDSCEQLRPWMPWFAQEPLTLAERAELIAGWERDWKTGGNVIMGVFVSGTVAGGCGLYRRIGPRRVDIGYWTHPSFLRQGIATTTARLLTDAAFQRPDITHVEIHHDRANVASAGIPRKLGFRLVREIPEQIEAPGEVGISCEWQIAHSEWSHSGGGTRRP